MSSRVARLNVVLEGVFQGSSPRTTRAGDPVLAKDGQPLYRVKLLAGDGFKADVQLLTVKGDALADVEPGEAVRIPAVVLVSKGDAGGVFVDVYGDAVQRVAA